MHFKIVLKIKFVSSIIYNIDSLAKQEFAYFIEVERIVRVSAKYVS